MKIIKDIKRLVSLIELTAQMTNENQNLLRNIIKRLDDKPTPYEKVMAQANVIKKGKGRPRKDRK